MALFMITGDSIAPTEYYTTGMYNNRHPESTEWFIEDQAFLPS